MRPVNCCRKESGLKIRGNIGPHPPDSVLSPSRLLVSVLRHPGIHGRPILFLVLMRHCQSSNSGPAYKSSKVYSYADPDKGIEILHNDRYGLVPLRAITLTTARPFEWTPCHLISTCMDRVSQI